MAQGHALGLARAAGQGLGMGWGDEGEAWLRSKLGGGDYEDLVKRIRSEYGQYSAENPGISTAAEFGSGVVPGVAAMFIPGIGAAQIGRLTLGGLARLAAIGGASGAVSGAGTADEQDRGSGALGGAALGAGLGVAIPSAMRGASGVTQRLRDMLTNNEKVIASRANDKMLRAMQESGITPKRIERVMAVDEARGIPSTIGNTDRALAKLTEAVAQRTGSGARKVESTLIDQRMGAKERSYGQVQKALKPEGYDDELAKIESDLKTRSGPAYDKARAYGEVTDPTVLSFLSRPQFIQGLKEAQRSADVLGETIDLSRPTVDMLDRAKQGIDRLIEAEKDSFTGKMTPHGRDLTIAKNDFLKALDRVVPDYELARGIYAGGAELKDAMRKGLAEFDKYRPRQLETTLSKMNDGEKQAFKTGVAQKMYSEVSKSPNNFNAAQRLLGGSDRQEKLQMLFNNPAEFRFFKAALTRESQLFDQSNRILGGSQTSQRQQMASALDDSPGLLEAGAQAITGGWKSGLTGLAFGALRSAKMSEKTASKLADMLMSNKPSEVAAVVKALEAHAKQAVPKAIRATQAEAGGITGVTGYIDPAPSAVSAGPDIEDSLLQREVIEGPDIEEDLLKSRNPASNPVPTP